jgi:tetratricopeptide (TPR) repeat protein
VTAAEASGAYAAYRAAHPATSEDDLLMVARGDSIGHVLAVLGHPDGGYEVERVRVRALEAAGPREVPVDELGGAGADAPGTTYLVDVRQRCGDAAEPRAAFDSWLFLPGNRLAAWDVGSFGPGCRPEPRQVEASDHAAMREVGDVLYRAAGRGPFRYGVLGYEVWDDAFAAPTRASLLALLQKAALERPRDARAQLHLAVGLYAAGDRDGAIRALERAAALDPRWPRPQENLAVAHRQRGDREAAERAQELAREAGRGGVASGPPAAPEVP